jgi:hypothetical protein
MGNSDTQSGRLPQKMVDTDWEKLRTEKGLKILPVE